MALCHDIDPHVSFMIAQEEMQHKNEGSVTTLTHTDGTRQQIDLQKHVKPHYTDEYTEETIPADWAHDAIQDGLDYFNDKVWRAIPVSDALKSQVPRLLAPDG